MKNRRSSMAADQVVMLIPFILIFMLFIVIPVFLAVILSFTDFDLVQFPSFVGLDNYIRMFLDDDVFLTAFKNTLLFALITGPVSYIACLFLAWLVNELSPKIRSLFTFCLYVPSMFTGAYTVWSYIFSGDQYGFINNMLMKFGFINEPVQWLSDTAYIMPVIIIIQLWLSLGTAFLSFLAGFQGIDHQQYEAAAIDGISNRFQEFWYITVPNMGPQLLFGAVMQIGASFAAGAVGQQLLIAAGTAIDGIATDNAATTIVTHMTDVGTTQMEMGYACSIAVFLFVMMLSFNHIIQNFLRKHSA